MGFRDLTQGDISHWNDKKMSTYLNLISSQVVEFLKILQLAIDWIFSKVIKLLRWSVLLPDECREDIPKLQQTRDVQRVIKYIDNPTSRWKNRSVIITGTSCRYAAWNYESRTLHRTAGLWCSVEWQACPLIWWFTQFTLRHLNSIGCLSTIGGQKAGKCLLTLLPSFTDSLLRRTSYFCIFFSRSVKDCRPKPSLSTVFKPNLRKREDILRYYCHHNKHWSEFVCLPVCPFSNPTHK